MEQLEKLVEKLGSMEQEILEEGVSTIVKEVPDGDGRAVLDVRLLKMKLDEAERAKQQRAKEKHKETDCKEDDSCKKEGGSEEDDGYEEGRAHMGIFNYNLNTKEIFTKYFEVETTYGKVPVWAYYPRRMGKNRPGLLYIHGGGFIGGTPFTVENECRLIAERADCTVFNIDYTLAPEGAYPVACIQVYEVLSYIHEHFAKKQKRVNHRVDFSLDVNRLVVAGDSAGGNLAAACTLMDRDKGTGFVKAQVLLYPKLIFDNSIVPDYQRDLSEFVIEEYQKEFLEGMLYLGCDKSNETDREAYAGKEKPLAEVLKEPYFSPVFGEVKGLPKTVFLLAEYDGLRLEGEFYAKKLVKGGIPVKIIRYKGVDHAFFDKLGIFPQAEDAVNEIIKVLQTL